MEKSDASAQDRANKPPTKRQLAALERRKYLVEMAATCFIEEGFHQTSIRDIAKKAGVSLGNLYNHFESKTQLIAEISGLEAADLESMRALLVPNEEGAIPGFVSAYFDYLSTPENAVLAAEITAEAMRSPEVAEAFTRNRDKTRDALARQLNGETDRDADAAQVLADLLLNLIEAMATSAAFDALDQKAKTRNQVLSAVDRLI